MLAGCWIRCSFRSILVSRKSSAGEGNPAETFAGAKGRIERGQAISRGKMIVQIYYSAYARIAGLLATVVWTVLKNRLSPIDLFDQQ